ncbi:hypothetical protein VNO78_09533 [Psophocarpus tetragonolobus]|uniref:Uncharacterized protein n=1 Tax=Psophocarpus tetragonolobus TaxID=3891 RepID=A0AAN9SX72_PSOTE
MQDWCIGRFYFHSIPVGVKQRPMKTKVTAQLRVLSDTYSLYEDKKEISIAILEGTADTSHSNVHVVGLCYLVKLPKNYFGEDFMVGMEFEVNQVNTFVHFLFLALYNSRLKQVYRRNPKVKSTIDRVYPKIKPTRKAGPTPQRSRMSQLE